jgi:5-methylcytosine-specific restriction protein A
MRKDRYLCRLCSEKGRPEPAVCVDHIVPVALGGKDEESNLRALCGPCHYDVTLEQFNKTPKAEYGDDGWKV